VSNKVITVCLRGTRVGLRNVVMRGVMVITIWPNVSTNVISSSLAGVLYSLQELGKYSFGEFRKFDDLRCLGTPCILVNNSYSL